MVQSAADLPRPARQGDGFLAHLQPAVVATDANVTLTVAQLAFGLIQFTGFTAGRNLTTPTAAQILAANPGMDIGDTFLVMISITPAFAGTYVAGTNVTLAGRTTALASTFSMVLVTKLSATTVEWRGL
jgi:hypothetical protein